MSNNHEPFIVEAGPKEIDRVPITNSLGTLAVNETDAYRPAPRGWNQFDFQWQGNKRVMFVDEPTWDRITELRTSRDF